MTIKNKIVNFTVKNDMHWVLFSHGLQQMCSYVDGVFVLDWVVLLNDGGPSLLLQLLPLLLHVLLGPAPSLLHNLVALLLDLRILQHRVRLLHGIKSGLGTLLVIPRRQKENKWLKKVLRAVTAFRLPILC